MLPRRPKYKKNKAVVLSIHHLNNAANDSFSISIMHLATTALAALMAAGASASPIEARQIVSGKGSISLYSEAGCHASNLLAENVTITVVGGWSACLKLDTPVASVKFNGAPMMGTLPWTSEFLSSRSFNTR